jgi:ribonucleoside-diphosphate reductase alpha chain
MNIKVKKRNGRLEDFNVDKINASAQRACEGIENVSASEIVLDAQLQLFEKAKTTEIDQALILSAREKIEKEPNYSFVGAGLVLNNLYKEVFKEGVDSDVFELQYRKSFVLNIKKLVKSGRFDKRLLNFDLKKLSEALVINRDKLIKYLASQILCDRYLTKEEGKTMESPQAFWMRVAMGLAIKEEDKEARAIEFYNLLSQFRYTSSTPTLFNSGTAHSQLSSCYLNTFDDSIDGIFDGAWQEARKSKFAGGLGLDVTPFRSSGAHIKGTNGISSGLIPWLKIYNDLLIAVNQGGKRPGAGCAYLEPWHLDYEAFLNLRRNTGDERLRCHDMNTASWIPDIFMRRVQKEGDWYMFNPSECPELHELFGAAFDKKYKFYCKKAEKGEVENFKKMPAKDLWKKMLKVLFETSHPWNTFKDPSNIRYSNQHEGAVHSSNLCTEILLHTKPSKYKSGQKVEVGETAVCNLGSINLKNHVRELESKDGSIIKGIAWTELAETIETAIRMLDNVVDINFYPTEEARNSNMQHRPIGLGMMGLHDVLHMLNISFDSDEAVRFNDELFEFYSYHAIAASNKLAKERGSYQSFDGSLWSQGILPMDTFKSLMEYRGKDIPQPDPDKFIKKDWDALREEIKETGMRNSNTMAIAPTATIGYINGVEQSIEPNFSMLFVYENKSGNFYIMNEHFVRDMKAEGLWTPEIIAMVKEADGDVSLLNGALPDWIKEKYKTAFDRDIFKLIECNAVRQKWIDQGISFNLYNKSTSLKYLNDIYMAAWEAGLKTTYYLRNRGASKVEKSISEEAKEEGAESEPAACSILDPGCESCQ